LAASVAVMEQAAAMQGPPVMQSLPPRVGEGSGRQ
jgi:hypothetical protein